MDHTLVLICIYDIQSAFGANHEERILSHRSLYTTSCAAFFSAITSAVFPLSPIALSSLVDGNGLFFFLMADDFSSRDRVTKRPLRPVFHRLPSAITNCLGLDFHDSCQPFFVLCSAAHRIPFAGSSPDAASDRLVRARRSDNFGSQRGYAFI